MVYFYIHLNCMKYKCWLATFTFSLFIVSYCQSQNRKLILPKIQAAVDTLYPQAFNLTPEISRTTDPFQSVTMMCNCPEGTGKLDITFDTLGHIINKDIYISIKDLPAPIIDYMQSNYATGFTYNDYLVKSINKSKELSYKVYAHQQNSDGNLEPGTLVYLLKFNSSGEFISLDKELQDQ